MHDPYDQVGFDPNVFPPALRTASYFLAAAIIGFAFLGAIVTSLVV